MSYTYRERERDWDEIRPVSIKRYVISPEDDRRDFMSRHDDSFDSERELVIRRKSDREEPVTVSRYEREVEYEPPTRYERDYYDREYLHPYTNHPHSRSTDSLERIEQSPTATAIATRKKSVLIREARTSYTSPRESEYDVVRRSEVDEDPYYYHRHHRVREYDEHRSRRELSPDDSVSQTSRRRRSDRDQDYSSDDSMVYIRKETRDYDDHSHHRRHMAEGALVGAGAAELLRSHSKKDGEVSHGASRIGKTIGAGALGAVAVNAASHARDYYRRSKSRHRSHSFEDDRSSHRHSRHGRSRHSRSRSRSHSHSRVKTLIELGVGAAAVAAGVAALHSKSKAEERKDRSRSRTRTRSRSRAFSRGRSEKDGDHGERSMSERHKHMAGAGLAGAAVAGLVEKARSHSRPRKGERSRSHSRLRQALPIVSAGLATAAATGLYEKKKSDKEEKEGSSRGRHRSRSRSRAPSQSYSNPTRDSAGLIEYGNDPVAGSIPSEHYYGRPGAPSYDAQEAYSSRRHTRSRSRSRARYSRSSSSDREGRRRSKKHRSRSRDLAGAALGATGLGYAAHKYNERRKSKEREREHSKHDDNVHRDPYEESYDPEPYPLSPQTAPGAPPMADTHYYPNSNYFPPPPGDSTYNLNGGTPVSYNPADYPPPPGAAPPQPYAYGAAPPGPGPRPEQHAPRPRRADDNVSSSTLPTDVNYAHKVILLLKRPHLHITEVDTAVTIEIVIAIIIVIIIIIIAAVPLPSPTRLCLILALFPQITRIPAMLPITIDVTHQPRNPAREETRTKSPRQSLTQLSTYPTALTGMAIFFLTGTLPWIKLGIW
ncbi:hypothetical protein PDIG_38660 [Penicillium digitatum PHI26]|uniref:DUF3824 domain-containing protein n=2 Tax=Penicillium digitatum TaxID=36651 RepID=K9FWG0_PEND2|nr:hypothetical protein PDIP_85300 [Penicillium digitatum Pd1]EKV05038.1 hypothetical protein PDIP_85300 [Penicillium digitatum Pd1]EKV13484.1 hypothetical protein PDIG_38660 [Penicillium digitatum PHI26]